LKVLLFISYYVGTIVIRQMYKVSKLDTKDYMVYLQEPSPGHWVVAKCRLEVSI